MEPHKEKEFFVRLDVWWQKKPRFLKVLILCTVLTYGAFMAYGVFSIYTETEARIALEKKAEYLSTRIFGKCTDRYISNALSRGVPLEDITWQRDFWTVAMECQN